MPLPDHYRTLGVDEDANAAVIKARFRELAKLHHPDTGGARADADRFKAVSEAYETLGNVKKRALYDDERIWDTGAFQGNFNAGTHHDHRHRGADPRAGRAAAQSVLGRAFHPRVMLLAAATAVGYVFFAGQPATGGPTDDPADQLVMAWQDPQTRRWETPQPWNARYAAHRHTERMVKRHEVGRSYE
eukprot:g1666.t1